MSDARLEIVAKSLSGLRPTDTWPTNEQLGGNPTGTRDDEYRNDMLEQARGALTAADAVDAHQGIHRVKVDDAAVDRVARAIWAATGHDPGDWIYMAPETDRVQRYRSYARDAINATVNP